MKRYDCKDGGVIFHLEGGDVLNAAIEFVKRRYTMPGKTRASIKSVGKDVIVTLKDVYPGNVALRSAVCSECGCPAENG